MIGLGTAATQLDTAVNIAFPAITRGFGLAIGDIQWVVICYVLTYASLLLALGRIGDTVGHTLVFPVGLIWSAVALLLVSWSPSYGAMLVFRCLQGVGAALVLSCGAALVTSLYGEERRSRALGIYTMMLSFGLMLGPLLGGALTAVWDWPAVFLFRIPIAIAALLLLRAHAGIAASSRQRSLRCFGWHRADAGPGNDAVGAQPSSRIFRRLVRTAVRGGLCGLYLPRVARGASDHCRRHSQAAGFRAAQSRQRAGQSRGIFGLAAGAVFSGARPRLYADRERRHPGCSRGRGSGGRADRRSPGRAVHFRRAAGDSGCRRHWRRSSAARRVDGANPDNPADHGTLRAGTSASACSSLPIRIS